MLLLKLYLHFFSLNLAPQLMFLFHGDLKLNQTKHDISPHLHTLLCNMKVKINYIKYIYTALPIITQVWMLPTEYTPALKKSEQLAENAESLQKS